MEEKNPSRTQIYEGYTNLISEYQNAVYHTRKKGEEELKRLDEVRKFLCEMKDRLRILDTMESDRFPEITKRNEDVIKKTLENETRLYNKIKKFMIDAILHGYDISRKSFEQTHSDDFEMERLLGIFGCKPPQ